MAWSFTLFIDGRSASSGTIVIQPGQRGELQFPFGRFELQFNPAKTPANVNLSTGPNRITFDGTDNSLGVTSSFTIPFANGKDAQLTFAVYAIGADNNVTRIVHYTLS